MTTFLLSPAERPPISNLGQNSAIVETLGVDILWEFKGGKLAGVQRKEQMDLIASVRKEPGQVSRLGKELAQMKSLAVAFVVIEGSPAWDRSGNLMNQYSQWTIKQQMGVELSIQRQGFMVLHTRNPVETVSCVEYLAQWTEKDEHVSSLLYNPAPKNGWGKMTDRLTGVSILSVLNGIGTKYAASIFDHYKRVPCRHDLAENPPEEIDGIGPKRASSLRAAL